MELFAANPAENLLPHDGAAHYFGPILPAVEASRFFELLMQTIPWERDEVVLFGKHIITARKVAWFADSDITYTYSGTTKHARQWTPELSALKSAVESRAGVPFNSCLLNLYHSGSEGMGWHSDDEHSLVAQSAIGSMSFGAERKFCFKHKRSAQGVSVVLEHGSLLVMQGTTQSHWLHCVPKSKRVTAPRINLTFRCMRPANPPPPARP